MVASHDESSVSYWEERYNKNKIEWHLSDINPFLAKYLSLLVGGTSSKKFFIPLCGKTKDIPYLLSLGHQVFGLEAVLQPILELDEEHSLGLKFNEKTSVYSTEDGRCQIYYGDIFTCPIETFGPFDCVCDRGSFIAVAYDQREAYAAVMKRSLENSQKTLHPFSYLLITCSFDKKAFKGPPNSGDLEDVNKYYSEWASIQELEEQPILEDSVIHKVSEKLPTGAVQKAFLLTSKV